MVIGLDPSLFSVRAAFPGEIIRSFFYFKFKSWR